MASFVHPTSIVEEGASLGPDVFVGPFCHVRAGAVLGAGCVLGQGSYVAGSVRIGDRTRVQNGVSLFDGVEIGAEVFLGPHCVFTNVREPRACVSRRAAFDRIRVGVGATVGANATLLPGVTLGPHAFVGAGAVVTRDVDAYTLVRGNPARPAGHRSRHGAALRFHDFLATCTLSGWRYALEGGRVRCLDHDDLAPLGARVALEDLPGHG
jgi:UDP-2-acetamido-3-amino-2,3-dideoxy-glucuronate N-acetyltransferase